MDLTGQLALVTGAAQGIGQAIAHRLAAAGTRVILADIDDALGRAAAADKSDGPIYRRLDVTDQGAWVTLAVQLQGEGGLDIAFLNAGVISRPVRSAFELVGLWDLTIDGLP